MQQVFCRNSVSFRNRCRNPSGIWLPGQFPAPGPSSASGHHCRLPMGHSSTLSADFSGFLQFIGNGSAPQRGLPKGQVFPIEPKRVHRKHRVAFHGCQMAVGVPDELQEPAYFTKHNHQSRQFASRKPQQVKVKHETASASRPRCLKEGSSRAKRLLNLLERTLYSSGNYRTTLSIRLQESRCPYNRNHDVH